MTLKMLGGDRFGRLVVIQEAEQRVTGQQFERMMYCVCDCGAHVNFPLRYLRSGRKTHCGCNPKPLHWRVKDMTGQRFNRLVVLRHAGKNGASRMHRWECQCDCGSTVVIQGAALRSGATRSCGCLQREISRAAGDRTRTHGMTRTPTHIVWAGMMQRCHSKGAKDFPRYGGRGITVCPHWHTFANFLADMGERPANMSIDRIDNNKGYEPENCRWATNEEQQRNTSANRILRLGDEAKTMAEWAEKLDLKYNTLSGRLNLGWSDERALTTPVNKRLSRA